MIISVVRPGKGGGGGWGVLGCVGWAKTEGEWKDAYEAYWSRVK